MGKQATGRYAQAISDRSGQAFPYKEMVKEWTGALVHISEFEPKHPQLNPRNPGADAQGLRNARPQNFTVSSGGGGGIVANLVLPGDFAFSSTGMQPDDGSAQNRKRQAKTNVGQVTVVVS
jgi:hypothetical protein